MVNQNGKYNDLLGNIILPNEILTENNISPRREACGMQVSVIDAKDISLRADSERSDDIFFEVSRLSGSIFTRPGIARW